MKTALKHSLKLACLALALCGAQGAARAQKITVTGAQPSQAAPEARAQLQMATLDRLGDRAEKSVGVTVDENTIGLVTGMFRDSKDPEQVKVREALAGIRGVYVRIYEFADDGQWGEPDIADIRRQVGEPGWSRVVDIKSRKDGQKVEVYLRALPGQVGGLLVLATQPRELMVINMVGNVDLQKLASLQGRHGIPELDIFGGGDDDDRKPAAKAATKKP
ncbi:MAG: DUF4252 domain-containing protein [Acidobacteria bacterium]|nr:DUF4252 domain-containing protein [Acidobacteriota bacterium]